MSKLREIEQDDILSLINCAWDYGHYNDICMSALVGWASPITDADIERYARGLADRPGYGEEDYEETVRKITEWRSKHAHE